MDADAAGRDASSARWRDHLETSLYHAAAR
jgi:hypothetical protein